MKFLVTFTHTDGSFDQLTPEQGKGLQEWHQSFVAALADEKQTAMVHLQPPSEARVVRRSSLDGDLEVTNGPLLEGAESVGGYFVIEADSMDEAVEFCRRGRYMPGSNEIREIREDI